MWAVLTWCTALKNLMELSKKRFVKNVHGRPRRDRHENDADAAQREAKMARLMRRYYTFVPLICKVSDATIEMEFVDGPDLQEFISTHLTDDELVRSMYQKVDRIIDCIERSPIEHGDLNHWNFIVDSERNVWLVDFGHARLMRETDNKIII